MIWWKLSEPEPFQLPDDESEDVDVIDPYVPKKKDEEGEDDGIQNPDGDNGDETEVDDNQNPDEEGLTLAEKAILIESQI